MRETENRRERLRAEMTAEIKAIALRLMAEEGPDAISLRAIAREIGVTPGALYGYFATRDALVTTLIVDVYSALADLQEAARDKVPESDPAGRVIAVGTAYRDWATACPAEFKLVYGDPVHGYQRPDGGAALEAQQRACTVLTGLVAAGWPPPHRHDRAEAYSWSDFDPGFAGTVRGKFPDLPPAGVALALRVWGRMHGLLALEVYGHLHDQIIADPGKLYRLELLDLIDTLGL